MTEQPSLSLRSLAWRWSAVLFPGLLLYFLPLGDLNGAQRHLLAIFVSTILSLVVQPLPMGASVIVALAVLVLTGTLPGTQVLSGFGNSTVWLIFSALLFGKAVTLSGFGSRVAHLVIRRFGKNPLSLAYSLAFADLLLAPFVPSDTARGGGIICPIAQSIALAFDSKPGPRARRLGAFLMVVGFHTTYIASAMFLTAMAANPLVADFAKQIGHVDLTWGRWALGACVPGVLSLILVPYLLVRVYPPEVSDTAKARVFSSEELSRVGPMAARERMLVMILLGTMAGWITSPWHGISNTFVALSGVAAILIAGVVSWNDLLGDTNLWDAFVWFGGLIMMAEQLNSSGTVGKLVDAFLRHLPALGPITALIVIALGYFYIHYGFASMTAQISALYPVFLLAALTRSVPPYAAVLALAYFSNLNAGLTHYGTGSAPIYFAAGYVSQSTWWRVGFLVSLLNVIIWLGPGLLWWHLLGLW